MSKHIYLNRQFDSSLTESIASELSHFDAVTVNLSSGHELPYILESEALHATILNNMHVCGIFFSL